MNSFHKTITTHNNRVVTSAALGDMQKVIADLNQVIQINPKYADAYYNRGKARTRLGDAKRAISDILKIWIICYKSEDAIPRRGITLGYSFLRY
jgi:tetratricopeptide (TPR) repeat protein